jgi:hypothetical protein
MTPPRLRATMSAPKCRAKFACPSTVIAITDCVTSSGSSTNSPRVLFAPAL